MIPIFVLPWRRLHRDQPALGIEREAVRAVGVLEKGRRRAVRRDSRDAVGLRLGEDQRAVRHADRSLGALKAGLDHVHGRPTLDDAGDVRRDRIGRRRLRLSASLRVEDRTRPAGTPSAPVNRMISSFRRLH